MKSSVVAVVDNAAKFFRAIDTLVGTRVMVGVPEDKSQRRDSSGISNAALAYIHEHGEPLAHIPPRPFLAPGIDRVKGDTVNLLKKAGELALDGKPDAVERQLHRVGLLNQASVRNVITEGIPPPLAASTIAGRIRRVKGAKRRASIKSELDAGTPASRQSGTEGLFTPLIVTGQFLKSVTYVLRKVSKKS
jgi:hypothetical protein